MPPWSEYPRGFCPASNGSVALILRNRRIGSSLPGSTFDFACHSAVEWHDRHDDFGLSTGPFSRPARPKCCAGPTSGLIHVCVKSVVLVFVASVTVGSFLHISPTGVSRSHGVAPAAFPSYTNVPNTHPVVAFARESRTATSTCNSRTVWIDLWPPLFAETFACHSKSFFSYGTCSTGAVVNGSLHATVPSGKFTLAGSGAFGSFHTCPITYPPGAL
jgi:hypothetical protein